MDFLVLGTQGRTFVADRERAKTGYIDYIAGSEAQPHAVHIISRTAEMDGIDEVICAKPESLLLLVRRGGDCCDLTAESQRVSPHGAGR